MASPTSSTPCPSGSEGRNFSGWRTAHNMTEKQLYFKRGFIVSIDGPAGAGKSTVSRQLADALGGVLLDTGAMYRAVAYFAIHSEVKLAKDFGNIARRLEFDYDKETKILTINGQDLGSKIRSEEVSVMASAVSRFKSVRLALTRRQRAMGKKLSRKVPVVMEGRDIGTVVFPEAKYKFFVTASAEVRAERRLKQLKKMGIKGDSLKSVLKQQEARDRQDSSRKLAPLRCPEGAVVVDTSSMGIPQVVHFLSDHIRNVEELRK